MIKRKSKSSSKGIRALNDLLFAVQDRAILGRITAEQVAHMCALVDSGLIADTPEAVAQYLGVSLPPEVTA